MKAYLSISHFQFIRQSFHFLLKNVTSIWPFLTTSQPPLSSRPPEALLDHIHFLLTISLLLPMLCIVSACLHVILWNSPYYFSAPNSAKFSHIYRILHLYWLSPSHISLSLSGLTHSNCAGLKCVSQFNKLYSYLRDFAISLNSAFHKFSFTSLRFSFKITFSLSHIHI